MIPDALMALRVLQRYAGDVINLPSNKHVIAIGGRKYVLSNDGGALGIHDDDEEGDELQIPPSDGARLIMRRVKDNWRYLWVYDTDKQIVAMWRVTDGNDKHWSPARSETHHIAQLEKKRQLNRVTHDEFVKIQREMDKRAKDNERAMVQYIRDNESDQDKRINQLAEEYFDRNVRPEIERVVASIQQGVAPLGFKPHSPDNIERQKTVHVMSRVFDRSFTVAQLEEHLRDNGILIESGGELQQVEWTRMDIVQRALEEYVPARE